MLERRRNQDGLEVTGIASGGFLLLDGEVHGNLRAASTSLRPQLINAKQENKKLILSKVDTADASKIR